VNLGGIFFWHERIVSKKESGTLTGTVQNRGHSKCLVIIGFLANFRRIPNSTPYGFFMEPLGSVGLARFAQNLTSLGSYSQKRANGVTPLGGK
jgi:hypothetical protein